MLRRTVVHGSIEWTQGLTLEQMLQQKWFVRSKSHDPKHWSYHVLLITDMCPLAKLAADTVANQGSDRKEYASIEASGATTHVCMWPDPVTKKPCGHSWHLKPKMTKGAKRHASDPNFSVFSHHCDSVQSSNVTQHLASKHQSVTDAKVMAGRRQETGFAHAASTDVRTGIRKLLSDAPNTKALKHVMQRYAMLQFYLYGSTLTPLSMFEDKAFRDMMWSFDPTGATFYAALVKEFIDLEFNHFLLMLGRALQDSAKFHRGNPFAQLSHDAAWLSNHES